MHGLTSDDSHDSKSPKPAQRSDCQKVKYQCQNQGGNQLELSRAIDNSERYGHQQSHRNRINDKSQGCHAETLGFTIVNLRLLGALHAARRRNLDERVDRKGHQTVARCSN